MSRRKLIRPIAVHPRDTDKDGNTVPGKAWLYDKPDAMGRMIRPEPRGPLDLEVLLKHYFNALGRVPEIVYVKSTQIRRALKLQVKNEWKCSFVVAEDE